MQKKSPEKAQNRLLKTGIGPEKYLGYLKLRYTAMKYISAKVTSAQSAKITQNALVSLSKSLSHFDQNQFSAKLYSAQNHIST